MMAASTVELPEDGLFRDSLVELEPEIGDDRPSGRRRADKYHVLAPHARLATSSRLWMRILVIWSVFITCLAAALAVMLLKFVNHDESETLHPDEATIPLPTSPSRPFSLNQTRASVPYRPSLPSMPQSLSFLPLPSSDAVLQHLVFGSCSAQDMPQPYWDTILVPNPQYYVGDSTNASSLIPDLLILMGDNVYGDCDNDGLDIDLSGYANETNATINATLYTIPVCHTLYQSYQEWAQHPSAQGAALQLSVFPTLDDHDYGLNDAHAMNNPYRDVARSLFAQFFQFRIASDHDEPDDSTGLVLPVDGVYRSKVWGISGRRVQIILLDTRYNRSPFFKESTDDEDGGNYRPPLNDEEVEASRNSTMLGERQWKWLHRQLFDVKAELRIIVSSVQVLNPVTGAECWRHLPHERQRFLDLVLNHDKPQSIFILSGDRHVGGFYQYNSTNGDISVNEVTASAWTHSVPLASSKQHSSLHPNCDGKTAALCDEQDPSRLGSLIRENHFGTLHVNWDLQQVTIALRRTETTYGIAYSRNHTGGKTGDAGQVLMSRTYKF
jgi:alkaline phosphatase D